MSDPIQFWFDFSCPYAYLASTQLDRLAQDSARPVVLKPFLLGGVFRALEQPQNMSTTLSPPKAAHNRMDLLRWAHWLGVELRSPPRHPNRTVEALRLLLLCPPEHQGAVMAAFYRLYWAEAGDISSRDELSRCLDQLGLPGPELVSRVDEQAIKDELRTRTEEASQLGIFGAPVFIVDGQLFWGQDRLEMVVAAAKGWRLPDAMDEFIF